MINLFKKTSGDAAQLVNAEACKSRGNAFLGQDELEQAAACYREAMALKPDYAEARLAQSVKGV